MAYNSTMNTINIDQARNTAFIFHYIYGITAGLAILVNIAILLLILCHRHLLRKPTNLLLCSLALADLLTGLGLFLIPNTIVPWQYYNDFVTVLGVDIFCPVFSSYYLFFTFGSISIVTITIIAYERWIAISQPRRYRNIFTRKKTIIALVVMWLLVPSLTIDHLMMIKANQNATLVSPCHLILISRQKVGMAFYLILFELLRIVIPIFLITSKYRSISKQFYYRHQSITKSYIVRSLKLSRIRRLTRMVAAATLILLICWLPYEIYRILYLLQLVAYNDLLDHIFIAMVVLNAIINPIIYAAMNTFCKRKVLAIWNLISRMCNSPSVKEATIIPPISDYRHQCGFPTGRIYY